MTAKEIIKKIESMELPRLEDSPGTEIDHRRVILAEIARRCGVCSRTVENWRTGKTPGRQSIKSLEMLLSWYERRHRSWITTKHNEERRNK